MSLIPQIDADACVAHGDCLHVAPQAFRLDDVAVVVGDAPDDVLIEAARSCPSAAIVLIDPETGEEVPV
jgi:ferredoxin